MGKERSVEDIRAEMAATRQGLKSSFTGLRESVEPKNIAKQGVEDVKQFASGEFKQAKAQFVDTEGKLRTKRVLAIAGAVVGTVALVVALNIVSNRNQINQGRVRKAIDAK